MAHQSPHLTSDELDALVRDGAMGAEREAHARECASCAERVRAAQRVRATLTGFAQPAVAGAPLTADCREPAEIAVLIGGTDAASTAFLSHAVSCEHCGPMVEAALSETYERDEDRALLADLQTGRPEWRRQMAFRLAAAGRQQPVMKRRWIAATAGLMAAAALVVLAVRIARSPVVDRPELQELVAAVASVDQRPVDGRLTGGFAYAPPPTLLRGPAGEAAPRVRIAAAKLEETARANDTAAAQAAVGVGFLAVGELDKAVDALEDAVLQTPGEARYQSDLAAAYLARAKWRDRAEDWPKALAAAERALQADATLLEAHFNRALALEGLHLTEEAISAWTAYQSLEPSSKWSTEAAEHATKLRELLSAPKPQSNQELRERIEDQLLMKWGEAVLAGDTATAARLLDEAESKAADLVKAGGDTMASDELARIRLALVGGDRSRVTAFARAHSEYGRARENLLRDRVRQASDAMNEAGRLFATVGSGYSRWASIYNSIAHRIAGSQGPALEILSEIDVTTLPIGHEHLRGRYYWTRAAALEALGRIDLARDNLRLAVEAFGRANELENLSTNESGLAETEWLLGNTPQVWSHQREALSKIHSLPVTTRRNTVLLYGSIFALSAGLPEVALYFQKSLLNSIERAGHKVGRTDAYLRRAGVLASLGRLEEARNDLTVAQQGLSQIDDSGLRARAWAEINRVAARVSLSSDPATAIEASDESLAFYRKSASVLRVAELLSVRGRAQAAQGDLFGARSDMRAAISVFEEDRGRLSLHERSQAFEQLREVFRDLVGLEAIGLGDSMEALRIAERGRARSLAEAIGGNEQLPLDPVVHRGMSSDVAVVFYAVLRDRVLGWVLTNDRVAPFSSAVTDDALESAVRRVQRAVHGGATFEQLKVSAAGIVQQIIEPAVRLSSGKSVIVFIPDGVLSLIPFSALADVGGEPLIATRAIAVAPSFSTFVLASAQLTEFVADDVLAVGDGHDTALSGLPRLALANDEAVLVGRLYPRSTVLRGADATRARFLLEDRTVVHFSGHTVVNAHVPMFSRLLLAPDPTMGDSGFLSASQIANHRFPRTKLVVLATCAGAAGPLIEGEGLLSVARTFMNAGVPSVVASLWPIEDTSHGLLVGLHRELRNGLDPAHALSAAQLAILKTHPDTPVRIWGGFVSLGGVSPTRPS